MFACHPDFSDDVPISCLPQVIDRYHEAGFEDALQRSFDYKRAAEELAGLYAILQTHTENKVSKAVKELLFKDTITAITCCDGLARNKAACKRLVTAACKALPQAKGKQVQRAYKAQFHAAAKAQRKEDSGGTSAQPCHWDDLPADVLGRVLARLDPFSLASAGAVCQAWHAESHRDSHWQRLCLPHSPSLGRAGDRPREWRREFHRVAYGGGGRPGTGGLMRWRSNRVLCHDKLHWVDPSRDDKGAASSDQYPDVRRVSAYIVHGAGISALDSSDSEDDEAVQQVGRLWKRLYL